MSFLTKWRFASLSAGVALWLFAVFQMPAALTLGILGKIFLFAPLVVLPLILLLIRGAPGKSAPLFRGIVILQPFAATAVLVSFYFSSGVVAGMLAAVWFGFTGLLALFGLLRLVDSRFKPIEDTAQNIGLIYFAVGGAWITLARLGLQPMGFSDPIVLLTAIHFHFAGGSLQIIAGQTGKALGKASCHALARWLYWVALAGVIAGPPLLAAGITGSPLLEWIASLLLAFSILLLGSLSLVCLVPQKIPSLAKVLLSLAFASVLLSMGLAGLYAYGEWTGQTLISINYMADTHGIANAFGFVFCSLLAFLLIQRDLTLPEL